MTARIAGRRTGLRWLGLAGLVMGVIVLPFLLFETQIGAWTEALLATARARPALGGGLVVGLLAGDVLLPVPSSVVSAFAGAAFGWRLGAVLIWTGMTLGCVVGYALGARAGRGLAARIVGADELARARGVFEGLGPLALVLTRAVPVLAESAVLAAGAARMPLVPFLVSTSLANAGVAAAYAGIGATAAASQSFLIVFLGLVAAPALAWAVWRLVLARRARPA